jgi:hypothetical protein
MSTTPDPAGDLPVDVLRVVSGSNPPVELVDALRSELASQAPSLFVEVAVGLELRCLIHLPRVLSTIEAVVRRHESPYATEWLQKYSQSSPAKIACLLTSIDETAHGAHAHSATVVPLGHHPPLSTTLLPYALLLALPFGILLLMYGALSLSISELLFVASSAILFIFLICIYGYIGFVLTSDRVVFIIIESFFALFNVLLLTLAGVVPPSFVMFVALPLLAFGVLPHIRAALTTVSDLASRTFANRITSASAVPQNARNSGQTLGYINVLKRQYRLLISLYPRAFVEEFGAEMELDFDEALSTRSATFFWIVREFVSTVAIACIVRLRRGAVAPAGSHRRS